MLHKPKDLIRATGALASVAAVVLAVGSVRASASAAQHQRYSDVWLQHTEVYFENSAPFQTSCPLFPDDPIFTWPSESGYMFDSVNLTADIKRTDLPYSSDGSLWRLKAVGRVDGVINAADGTYTVTSGALKEDRIDSLLDGWLLFQGSGRVTITGPGGTVTGKATFTDTTRDYPIFEIETFSFTSITRCHLN
jgi:hypothetical protein